MAAIHIFVDSHVHFYPCYDLGTFFTSAFTNSAQIAARQDVAKETPRILCLTESAGHDYFGEWLVKANNGEDIAGFSASVISGAGPSMIQVASSSGERLWLLPGRQINTSNGLEVSAFGMANLVEDGGKLPSIIDAVLQTGAVAALPWGVGKWLGARGSEVQDALECYSERVGVSDNANRPGFWPMPKLLKSFADANSLLAGSDPFPMAEGQGDVCRYGTIVTTDAMPHNGQQVLDLLMPVSVAPRLRAGSRESGIKFFINQISMQIRKRAAK